MQFVARPADCVVGDEFGFHAAGLQVGSGAVEVGNAVEQAAIAVSRMSKESRRAATAHVAVKPCESSRSSRLRPLA